MRLLGPAAIFSETVVGHLIKQFGSRLLSLAVLIGTDGFLQQGLELLPSFPADEVGSKQFEVVLGLEEGLVDHVELLVMDLDALVQL